MRQFFFIVVFPLGELSVFTTTISLCCLRLWTGLGLCGFPLGNALVSYSCWDIVFSVGDLFVIVIFLLGHAFVIVMSILGHVFVVFLLGNFLPLFSSLLDKCSSPLALGHLCHAHLPLGTCLCHCCIPIMTAVYHCNLPTGPTLHLMYSL